MPYYTNSSTTFIGTGKPVTLGVKANGGTVTVTMDFSGEGAGEGATEYYTTDGIFVIEPGHAQLTVAATNGASFELV
jgi:hypothetical protein